MSELAILVPKPSTMAADLLLPKSAVVADLEAIKSGHVLCYYEGGRYGSIGMDRMSERLRHAASRLVMAYPTSAKAIWPLFDFLIVGRYDGARYVTLEINNGEALEEWCGEMAQDVIGAKLPAGDVSWKAVMDAYGSGDIRMLSSTHSRIPNAWMKTRSGQVLRLDAVMKTATVHEYDDPSLPSRMASDGLRLAREDLPLIFGSNVPQMASELLAGHN